MKYIDIFNGDADGIFSLIQWRKAHPIQSADEQYLITGVKRDIALLEKVPLIMAKDANVTVLDVSFDKNIKGVKQALEVCHHLFYCDHHKADKLIKHEKLKTKINTEPTVCTGLLINGELKGKYTLWALAAAYGDGLDNIADKLIKNLNVSNSQRNQLKELGVLVNYNGYGSSVEDLHFKPNNLYSLLLEYDTPFDIIADSNSPFKNLKEGYDDDIALAMDSHQINNPKLVAVILDDAAWARRISGTYGNQLSANNPDKPAVVITTNSLGSYTVSLRAPKNNPYGASDICSQFDTGGGREGAAGVNFLPKNQLDSFLEAVEKHYYQ